MKIERILTNNALIVLDDEGNEKIVCGKGIGFKRKRGELIEPDGINKVFVLESQTQKLNQIEEFLNYLPIEYAATAKQIVDYGRTVLHSELSDVMVLPLADHIYAAVQRANEGESITNNLFWDVKRFYKEEFDLSMTALDIIEKNHGVRLPDFAATSIALHFINNDKNTGLHEDAYKTTKLIEEITTIVRYHFKVNYDEESANYYRFITHLKYFAKRVFEHAAYDDLTDPEFTEVIRRKYSDAFACAEKIEDFIMKQYAYPLTDEEKIYLSVHIYRVVHGGRDACDVT